MNEACVKAQAVLLNVMNDVTETWMNVSVGQMLELSDFLNSYYYSFAIINVCGESIVRNTAMAINVWMSCRLSIAN